MATPVANLIPLTGNSLIDGLTQGGAWTIGGSIAHTLTYSLNINDNGAGGIGPGGAWDVTYSTAISQAFTAWSNVANLQFTQISSGTFYFQSTADLAVTRTGNDLSEIGAVGLAVFPDPNFANSLLLDFGFSRASYPNPEGDIFLDNFSLPVVAPGSNGFAIMLHEIGHALGLKHTTDDGENSRPTFASLGISGFDSIRYTVMNTSDFQSPGTVVFPVTPMPLDILAIQHIYGANMSFHAGDDVYTLQDDGPPGNAAYRTIWDAGGTDTIDLSGLPEGGAVIDLNPGAYSGNSLQFTAIAYDVVIENAVGSPGHDTITGNAANNVLIGGNGDDRIRGGAGNDTLIGGPGGNILDGGTGDDTYELDSGAANGVNEAANEGIDTVRAAITYSLLANVENLTLTGTANLNGTGNELDNVLTGNSGNNVLDGGAANDTLIGGQGNDTYFFGAGDGQDRVQDVDAAAGNNDTVILDFLPSDINVIHQGNDLVILVKSSTDQLTLSQFELGSTFQIESVQFADSTIWDASTLESNVNFAPVVTVNAAAVRPNEAVLMSSLFSVTDADGDAITQYKFWDDTPGGGFFTVNGVAQPWSGSSIIVNAANLAKVSYVGGATNGSETLWVRAFDGVQFSTFQTFTMSTVNHVPVVSASNGSVLPNQAVLMSSLFSVTDADGDAITQYKFWDDTPGGGFFRVNGVAQPWSGSSIIVNAADLSKVSYVGGPTNGSETLWVRAFDAFEGGEFKLFTMQTVNHAPVVSASNGSVLPNQAVLMSSLFSVSDADGDAITQYKFWDDTPGGGFFRVNGVAQPWSGSSIIVNAADLAEVSYVGGATNGSETLWVRAFDGIEGGEFKLFTMQTVNHAPVVSASNGSVLPNQAVLMSSLFSVSDADGDAITQYKFWDDTPGGGFFRVNGVAQPWSGSSIIVNAADLSKVSYVGGPTNATETLWVRAFDAVEGGAFKLFTMQTVNHAPVVSATNGSVLANQSVLMSSLFSVTDADGDAITQYKFWDDTPGGGFFTVNGVAQPWSGSSIIVDAADLAKVSYVGGPTNGSETLWVRAFDAFEGGAFKLFTMSTVNHAPVVSASNGSVLPNQAVLMSSLFSVTDADGDAITQYKFWDDTPGGGFFTVNGVAQPWSGSSIIVDAADLAKVSYVGGPTNGSETLWVRAFDAFEGGAFKLFTMSTVNHAPVVSASNGSVLPNQAVLMSSLFSVTDADGDAITQYKFWDDTPGGGFFTVNGAAQPWSGSSIIVNAADLAKVSYVGGPTNATETLWVRAFDGIEGGEFKLFTMTTLSAPTSALAAISVRSNDLVAPAGEDFHAGKSVGPGATINTNVSGNTFAPTQTMSLLQMIAKASADFDAGSSDPLLNKKTTSFDFSGLDPFVTAQQTSNWAIMDSLLSEHLADSDGEALGGDLTYGYGVNTTPAHIAFDPAAGMIPSGSFGSVAQSLPSTLERSATGSFTGLR